MKLIPLRRIAWKNAYYLLVNLILPASARVTWIFLVLWIAFLAYGAYHLRGHKQQAPASRIAAKGCLTVLQKKSLPHWITALDLPLNWRIRMADLSPGTALAASDLVGRYATCKVSAGDPVIQKETEIEPALDPPGGKENYLYRLKAGQEAVLNAGSRIDLFRGSVAVISGAEVGAVRCSGGCEAVLQLTTAEVKLLEQPGAAASTFVLRK